MKIVSERLRFLREGVKLSQMKLAKMMVVDLIADQQSIRCNAKCVCNQNKRGEAGLFGRGFDMTYV